MPDAKPNLAFKAELDASNIRLTDQSWYLQSYYLKWSPSNKDTYSLK